MKYVFFGSPRFAAIVLGDLIRAKMPPVAVVCNPDRPVGRKKVITPPPVKETAAREHITVFQPETPDETFIEGLDALRPDLFVVAAYAKMIPRRILDIPRLGTLGTHPSLLPKYRGASPIQSVILNGERETGVAIYRMDEKMDHGAIYRTTALPFESLSTQYPELEELLAHRAAELLIHTMPEVMAGREKPQEQDETRASYTKKFKTSDAFVEEARIIAAEQGNKEEAEKIVRMINAFTPEPGCWTIRNGARVKLLKARVMGSKLAFISTQKEGERPRMLQEGL